MTESGLLHMHNTEHMRNKELQLGILNAKKEQTKETKKIFNIFESNNDLIEAVRKSEEATLKRIINSNRNIFDEQQKIEKLVKGQPTLQEEVLLKLRQQNNEFSLSSEILGTINSITSKVSRSIAEAVVLGKSLNMSFK